MDVHSGVLTALQTEVLKKSAPVPVDLGSPIKLRKGQILTVSLTRLFSGFKSLRLFYITPLGSLKLLSVTKAVGNHIINCSEKFKM